MAIKKSFLIVDIISMRDEANTKSCIVEQQTRQMSDVRNGRRETHVEFVCACVCFSFLSDTLAVNSCSKNNMANNTEYIDTNVTPPQKVKRQRRPWSPRLSERFCREVLFHRPYSYPVRSPERKKAWDTIYDKLW